MAVISTRDQNNMFKYNNAIYASHVYLDTIYVFENDKIKKIFLDFPKENLPFSILTFELLESQNSILDTDQFAFHYPFIRISDQFILSKYVVNNVIYFFIQNKYTNNVISGRKFIEDMSIGIKSINPILLDQKGNLFSVYEYEDLWARNQNGNKKTLLNDFMEKIDPNINYVLIKYKLKNF